MLQLVSDQEATDNRMSLVDLKDRLRKFSAMLDDIKINLASLHNPKVNVLWSDTEISEVELPMPVRPACSTLVTLDTILVELEHRKAEYVNRTKEIRSDLPVSEKKKLVTASTKNYYVWFTGFVEESMVNLFGDYRNHKVQYQSRIAPTYTTDGLHNVCLTLIEKMSITIYEPSIQKGPISFLTPTRIKKIRSIIVHFFVLYNNHLRMFMVRDKPGEFESALQKCYDDIRKGNFTITVAKKLNHQLQAYYKTNPGS